MGHFVKFKIAGIIPVIPFEMCSALTPFLGCAKCAKSARGNSAAARIGGMMIFLGAPKTPIFPRFILCSLSVRWYLSGAPAFYRRSQNSNKKNVPGLLLLWSPGLVSKKIFTENHGFSWFFLFPKNLFFPVFILCSFFVHIDVYICISRNIVFSWRG